MHGLILHTLLPMLAAFAAGVGVALKYGSKAESYAKSEVDAAAKSVGGKLNKL